MVRAILTSCHAKSTLLSMNALRQSKMLCDVVLRVEERDFSVHRIVLAACSDYFCAMFTNQMSERDQSLIPLHQISASVMEVLLDFVYTERVNVTYENVKDLLPAACMLQLLGVKQACSEFLEKELAPANCLGILSFAEAYSCTLLKRAAEAFACENFEEIVRHEEFFDLSVDNVEMLIKNDEIQVLSEELIFEAVMNWVKYSQNSREQQLARLLSYVRLPLLSARYITDVVDEEELIKKSLSCRDLVDEAKKFHLRPELRARLQNERTQHRTGGNDFLVVVGGFGNSQSPTEVVEKYNPRTREWTTLKNMQKKRRYVAAASIKNKLYVIGGYDGTTRLNEVDCLDLTEDEPHRWHSVASMHHRRGLAGTCSHQGLIYICGGFDGTVRHTSMERYDPNIDQWNIVGYMNVGREGAGLVVADDVIYCIGGYDGIDVLNSMEKFDLNTGQWSSAVAMTTRRSGAGIAVLGDTIFLCGGYDGSTHLSSVECYNVRTGYWTEMTSLNVPRCYVGACILKGKLHVIAGYNGSTLLNTVEYFNQKEEKWEILDVTMTTHRCDAGVTVAHQR